TETYGLNNADFISSKSGEPVTANNWAATNTGLVNQLGSLTPSGGTGRSYTYDADGNVLSDGVNNYTWDAENRLLSITNISTGHVSNFTYDGLGRRVAITETSGGTPVLLICFPPASLFQWCSNMLRQNGADLSSLGRNPSQRARRRCGTCTDHIPRSAHGSAASSANDCCEGL
ncbi:MAG: hypothetical protein P4L54_03655, partial [Acidocella sp.]|nr:hypothetical protein [Acidocella sp.]